MKKLKYITQKTRGYQILMHKDDKELYDLSKKVEKKCEHSITDKLPDTYTKYDVIGEILYAIEQKYGINSAEVLEGLLFRITGTECLNCGEVFRTDDNTNYVMIDDMIFCCDDCYEEYMIKNQ